MSSSSPPEDKARQGQNSPLPKASSIATTPASASAPSPEAAPAEVTVPQGTSDPPSNPAAVEPAGNLASPPHDPLEAVTTVQDSEEFLPAQHWQNLTQHGQEAGHDDAQSDADADSALGEDTASSTTSISSSILHYRHINGRRYHAEWGNANYWAANDDQQNNSMELNHHQLLVLFDDRLFLAPLKKDIEKSLDIGTGTGIWAIDFADEFPNTQVIGTDISPTQPTWVPPNVSFEIEDCTQPWTFSPNCMDYVHMRYLLGSIVDWNALFREAYRVCKPGGWVESHEAEPRFYTDDFADDPEWEKSATNEWKKFFRFGSKKLGRPFFVIEEDLQRKGMEAAGFVDIQALDVKAPTGPWAKDPKLKQVGQFSQMATEEDVEGYCMMLAGMMGWSRDDVLIYCAQLRREIRSSRYHPYYRQRLMWGRKPE